MASRLEEIRNEKIKKLEALKKERYNPYEIEKFEKEYDTNKIKQEFESVKENEESEKMVKTAGRITSIRGHGKLFFLDLNDFYGKIQIIVRADKTNNFDDYKYIGVGDYLGVEGPITKTKSGELSIIVKNFQILTKNIMPLPDKWHGLEDPEIKYRKRYLDLAIDKDVREKLYLKFKMIEEIRKFLTSKGFLEVETPVLHSLLSGASAKPFITHHNACLLYTSDAADDLLCVDLGGRRIIKKKKLTSIDYRITLSTTLQHISHTPHYTFTHHNNIHV